MTRPKRIEPAAVLPSLPERVGADRAALDPWRAERGLPPYGSPESKAMARRQCERVI